MNLGLDMLGPMPPLLLPPRLPMRARLPARRRQLLGAASPFSSGYVRVLSSCQCGAVWQRVAPSIFVTIQTKTPQHQALNSVKWPQIDDQFLCAEPGTAGTCHHDAACRPRQCKSGLM